MDLQNLKQKMNLILKNSQSILSFPERIVREDPSQSRNKILTEPYKVNIFNRTEENNRKICQITKTIQFHVSNSYCCIDNIFCRFGFRFSLQKSASIPYRVCNGKSSRLFCLCPRNSSNINSTHPMLSVGYYSTIYVCNYTVKADKQYYF